MKSMPKRTKARRKRAILGIVGIIAVIMLVAAACGGDDTPTPAPSTPAPSTPTPAPATPTPAPSTPTPPPTTPDTPTPTPSTPTPPPPTPTPTPGDQLRGPDDWTLDNPATRAEIEAEFEKFRGGQVRISHYGGAAQAAIGKAFFEPFEEQFGIDIVESSNSDPSLIRAQALSGNLQWDMAVTESIGVELMCAEGVVEELDMSIIDTRHLVPIAQSPCNSGGELNAGHVLAYSLETYPEGSVQPSSWQDFFDVDRFPGRRVIRNNWMATLWYPLMADDPDFLATEESRESHMTLTPTEIERAFELWEDFAPNISGFWAAGSECPQLLISGEADMCTTYNGRIYDAQQKGAPLKICWECGFTMDSGGWVVPKGLAEQDPEQFYLTQLFMAWITFPEINVRITDFIAYPPATIYAPQLLEDPRFDEIRDELPTSSTNIQYSIMMDPEWGGQVYDVLQERWQEFMQAQ